MLTIARKLHLLFNRIGYQKPTGLVYLLLPLSFLFLFLVRVRRWLYQHHYLTSISLPVPIIIVGNITVGGTGKTPFIIWLAHTLIEKGYHPGIISRGYGSELSSSPQEVTMSSLPQEVGDEPLLIVRHTVCPVVIGKDRVKAAQTLLSLHPDCNILLSDDGLQHYRLARNFEIVMVDGDRLWGNGYGLPAGPLREPIRRIQSCDVVIVNGGEKIKEHPHSFQMHLKTDQLHSVSDPTRMLSFTELQHKTIHALAGIGNPDRFFNELRKQGLSIVCHPFPDHYRYQFSDIDVGDRTRSVIIMTEKDAIKCQPFADNRHWFLPVTAEVEEGFSIYLQAYLNTLK